MDELYTMKSDSPIEYRKKNTQIISTLRSETDNDIAYREKKEKPKHSQKYAPTNNSTKFNLQDDIVNIAQTIHNLANMMNDQIEKISSLEKEISILKKKNEKTREIEKEPIVEYVYENKKTRETETESEIEHIIKNDQIINTTTKNRNISSANKKNKILDTCTSDTCNDYMITKNVEHKLKSVANGFNNELLEMKKQQAIVLSNFMCKKSKKACSKK